MIGGLLLSQLAPGFPAIVTRFHLRTKRLLPLYQSVYFYPVWEYKKVLQWVIDVCLSFYPPLIHTPIPISTLPFNCQLGFFFLLLY
jgi:hypothetical protein